jgi:hypothetical protein
LWIRIRIQFEHKRNIKKQTYYKFFKIETKVKKMKSSVNNAEAGAVWSRIESHHWVEPEPLSDAALAAPASN